MPTGVGAGAGLESRPNPPGVGAFVPANVVVLELNLFATLGLGREVIRSDVLKAADRSLKDFGSPSPPLLAAADVGFVEGGAPSDGRCALARIAAISTLPTGS